MPVLHLLAALGFLLVAPPAFAEPVEVTVVGIGGSRSEAIARGLSEAIQQATGVAVAIDEVMNSAMASAAVTVNGTDSQSVAIAEASQSAIRRTANGIVRSYRVIETEANEPGHVVLTLAVAVEKFEAKGLGNDSRRRIAVATFGGAVSQGRLREMLRDRVISYLTQARRFAVLDRANTTVYAQEMATIETQSPVTERVRAGQVIGADYVVVGTVNQAGVARSDREVELTGERIISASSLISIDWQVLEIATRQVKWTGTVRLNAGGDALGSLVDRAAARIGDEITQAIYPMRLIDLSDPNALIINQGGNTLHRGERFRAMLLGKQLFDPYTKEPLGQTEREVAVVEIDRVDSKVSYARVVSGQLPGADAEVVLRSAPGDQPQKQKASVKKGPPPVVKLPGDP
ncbi:hypothetical protein TSH100_28940 [Azospirillum sp. TSH100]|uniref:hypothetical protein n=1 Tax=Azospirillum sp. TSH100 TaxID=652764 RepID=UPI000D622239|nr:hypothetical protein [Azospirillum sp. TSH100]PWC80801.1 hypothetical protein TSH100_28940 [Azospirillum sp. TSH100]QCG92238.1 hypothetical protein E6C72_31110 [Azospirillum sp. TSH100]